MLTPHGHFEALLHSHAVLGFIRANMGGAIAAVGLAWGLTGCTSQRLPSTHGEQPEKCTHYPGLGAGRAGTQTQTVFPLCIVLLGEEYGHICLYFFSIFNFCFFLPRNLR